MDVLEVSASENSAGSRGKASEEKLPWLEAAQLGYGFRAQLCHKYSTMRSHEGRRWLVNSGPHRGERSASIAPAATNNALSVTMEIDWVVPWPKTDKER